MCANSQMRYCDKDRSWQFSKIHSTSYTKSIMISQKEKITHIDSSERIVLEQIIGLLYGPHCHGIIIYLLHSSLGTEWISGIVNGQLILWDQANWARAV